jgi:hypothetical protein
MKRRVMAPLPDPKKVVDVVVYKDGKRIVVGEAEVSHNEQDDTVGDVTITDENFAKTLLQDSDFKAFSIGDEKINKNIFDPKDKDHKERHW